MLTNQSVLFQSRVVLGNLFMTLALKSKLLYTTNLIPLRPSF